MSTGDKVVHGSTPPAEQKAELDSLRALFDPKAALDRADSYGKWLFGSATVVGALGAGLSNSAFSKLHGPSMWLFGAAVFCFGMCLVFASRSIAPKWVDGYYYQLKSMQDAANQVFAARERFLKRASVFFAVALFLAAAAPLASLWPTKNEPSIHYSIDEKGALDAGLEASDVQAGTIVDLRLESTDPKVLTPRTSTMVDGTHEVKLGLKMAGINSLTSNLTLVACLKKNSAPSCETTLALPIVQK